MSDINNVVVVSYTKHWDNDTKGTMEFPVTGWLTDAITAAETQLFKDAKEDGVSDRELRAHLTHGVPTTLFTITKAVLGLAPSNWLGV
jgi:hypothetical protein